MTFRLTRIPNLILSLTAVLAAVSLASNVLLPVGIVMGGAAAWLDFLVIKSLGAAMLERGVAVTHIVPMALTKSLVLVAIPAMALLLPAALVDGLSFAAGVTTLPLAVVLDACLTSPEPKTGAV